jgi:hypothetical protein
MNEMTAIRVVRAVLKHRSHKVMLPRVRVHSSCRQAAWVHGCQLIGWYGKQMPEFAHSLGFRQALGNRDGGVTP